MNYSHYHLIKEFNYTIPHTAQTHTIHDFVWMPLHHCKKKKYLRLEVLTVVLTKIQVFQDMMMYQLVRRRGVFSPQRWRQQAPQKCCQVLTNWHSTIKQKTVLLIILTTALFKIYLQRHIARLNAKLPLLKDFMLQ